MENYKKKLLDRYPATTPAQKSSGAVKKTEPEKTVRVEQKKTDPQDFERLKQVLQTELEKDFRRMQKENAGASKHPVRPWILFFLALSVIAAAAGWGTVYWLQMEVRPDVDAEMVQLQTHAQEKIDAVFAGDEIQNVIQQEVRDYSREKVEAYVETQANEMLNPWYGQITEMIGNLQSESEKALSNLEAITEVMILEAKAKNDDREAFEKLMGISRDRNHAYKTVASDAVKQIFAQFSTLERPVIDIKNPANDIDMNGLSFSGFRDLYSHSIPLYRPWLLTEMWLHEGFSKYERLDFLASVVRQDDSLSALERALRLMDFENGLAKPFTAYDFYLTWWADNKSSYQGS